VWCSLSVGGLKDQPSGVQFSEWRIRCTAYLFGLPRADRPFMPFDRLLFTASILSTPGRDLVSKQRPLRYLPSQLLRVIHQFATETIKNIDVDQYPSPNSPQATMPQHPLSRLSLVQNVDETSDSGSRPQTQHHSGVSTPRSAYQTDPTFVLAELVYKKRREQLREQKYHAIAITSDWIGPIRPKTVSSTRSDLHQEPTSPAVSRILGKCIGKESTDRHGQTEDVEQALGCDLNQSYLSNLANHFRTACTGFLEDIDGYHHLTRDWSQSMFTA